PVKIESDPGIKTRAPGNQVPHALAKQIMNSTKENPPKLPSKTSAHGIHTHQQAKEPSHPPTPLPNFFKDSLVNQVKELRHHGKGGDLAIAQGTKKLGRVQGGEIHRARAGHQREQ